MGTGHPKGLWRNREWRGGDGTSRGHPSPGTTTQQLDQKGGMLREKGLPSPCPHVQSDSLDGWVQHGFPSSFWSWDWWDHLPFSSAGLSKQTLNQSHLLHGSIPLLTLFPCFLVVSQRQPCRQEWGRTENPKLWDELVPYLGAKNAASVDSLGGGPRQHHHLASCTPLDSLEKWNRMLLPISREVWTTWLWYTNVTVSGNKGLFLWSKIVSQCQM